MLGSAVDSLRVAGGRVQGVNSSVGFHPASTVVLAAGTETAALCAPLGVRLPVAASPALLIRVAAQPGLVRTIVAGPQFEARELRDGHLLMTAPSAGEPPRPDLDRLAGRALQHLRSAFPLAGSARLIGWRLGRRPMPPGGPLVGSLTADGSAYVAVAHSAVTLAPTLGRLVAQELASGQPVAELRRCRPD
jgi:glycine/D-amino acid oxidase-like deaminating enzyme